MNGKTFARAATAAALVLTGSLAYPQGVPAVLTIHADQPVSAVSPTLYGLMTEEINYSYDGGLYAEMVRNRTFRGSWDGTQYWYLVEDGNAAAKMGVDKETGPSEALKTSLRIDVEQADARNQAGVLNVGWWGMALRPETTYKGSFYAKADSADMGPVTVSLVGNDSGKVVATATVSGLTTEWKQYEFTLKTGAIEASVGESPCPLSGTCGDSLAEPGLALPAHLPRPRERQSHRPDGEAGGDASGVPALPRRQLS